MFSEMLLREELCDQPFVLVFEELDLLGELRLQLNEESRDRHDKVYSPWLSRLSILEVTRCSSTSKS